MNYFISLALVATLAACSSTPKEDYEKRAYQERQRQEKAVETSISNAPRWMTETPTSTNAVFAAASGTSSDMTMSDWKAKMVAYGKICIAAGGRVSQQGKMFLQDNAETNVESSELVIKTMCPAVDITGTEVREIKRVAEGTRYRTYVLVALPTGDANLLQKRKDAIEAARRAQVRSVEAFKELETQ